MQLAKLLSPKYDSEIFFKNLMTAIIVLVAIASYFSQSLTF